MWGPTPRGPDLGEMIFQRSSTQEIDSVATNYREKINRALKESVLQAKEISKDKNDASEENLYGEI